MIMNVGMMLKCWGYIFTLVRATLAHVQTIFKYEIYVCFNILGWSISGFISPSESSSVDGGGREGLCLGGLDEGEPAGLTPFSTSLSRDTGHVFNGDVGPTDKFPG